MQVSDGQAPWGLIAALPIELGLFRGAGRGEVAGGVRLSAHQIPEGPPLLAAVSGVGKVAAAHAAAVLAARGVRGLLVVGTCGGLDPVDEVGTLVHAGKAVQWDLGVREGREATPDADLAAAWMEQARGPVRTFNRGTVALGRLSARAHACTSRAICGRRGHGDRRGPRWPGGLDPVAARGSSPTRAFVRDS